MTSTSICLGGAHIYDSFGFEVPIRVRGAHIYDFQVADADIYDFSGEQGLSYLLESISRVESGVLLPP